MNLFRHCLLSVAAFAALGACRVQTLEGGSSDAGPPKAPQAPEPVEAGADASPSGTRTVGDGCESTAQCASGLECLPFAVHPSEGGCRVVGTSCSKRCADGATAECSSLGKNMACFSGCAPGESVCGRFGPSGDVVTFTVEDDPALLTSNPNDSLFTLTVTGETPARAYPAATVAVSVEAPGQTGSIVPCTHNDTNSNGNVDVGETLHCAEPPLDKFNAADANLPLTVSFLEEQGAHQYSSRGQSVWTPKQ